MKSIKKLLCVLWTMVMLIAVSATGLAVSLDDTANPSFKVLYKAYISEVVVYPDGDASMLPITNTSNGSAYNTGGAGGKLPENHKAHTDNYLSYVAFDRSSQIQRALNLKEIYLPENYRFFESPGIDYIDQVSAANSNYLLSEIWVNDSGSRYIYDSDNSKSNKAPDGTHFPNCNLPSIAFTNVASETPNANQIVIKDNAEIQLIYTCIDTDPRTFDVDYFDYDVTDGRVTTDNSDTYNPQVNTDKQGINSSGNYKNDNDATPNFGFGNQNINSGRSDEAFKETVSGTTYDVFFNKANRLGESGTLERYFNMCAFGITQNSLDANGNLKYNHGINAPNLFNEGNAIGKTKVEGSLTFTHYGDYYRINSASAGGHHLDNLEALFQYDTSNSYNRSNNFYPMDNVIGADPHFGNNDNVKYYFAQDEDSYLPVSDDGKDHNHYFGMTFDVDFTLPGNYTGPMDYLFFGDDDMWIYLIPEGPDGNWNYSAAKKVCDIGGVHLSVGQYVNLWDWIAPAQNKNDHRNYRLRFFYNERGASGSACYMEFVLPQVWPVRPTVPRGSLQVEKTVSNHETYNQANQDFVFDVSFTGLNAVNYNYRVFEKSTDKLVQDYKIFNGAEGLTGLRLKHNQYALIENLPVNSTYYVVSEENAAGFEVSYNNQQGAITANTVTSATATNTRTTGNLKIEKVVQSDITTDHTKTYTFHVELSDKNFNATLSGITFVNGMATVAITGSTSKLIEGLPSGINYTVTEDEASSAGFTASSSGINGTIPKDNSATASFTNAKGGLKVSKAIEGQGADANKAFGFTVTLSDTSITGQYGDMNFTNGIATFTLKGGESCESTGLPANITYTVEETDYFNEGYVTTHTGKTGPILADPEQAHAVFTNRRDAGNLTVQKIVEGQWIDGPTNEAQNIEFSFKVVLSGEGTYTVDAENKVMIRAVDIVGEYGDMTFQPDVKNGVSYATFTLKHGESKTALDLPVGITYTVTEEDTRFTESMFINRVGEIDRIPSQSGSDLIAQGNIPANKTDTVTFTNIRNTGDLVVKKIVTGADGETNRDFEFTVTLDEELTGTYGEMLFTKGVASFALKHGESKTATGLPSDVNYTVTETYPAPAEGDEDGYTVTAQGSTDARPDPLMLLAFDEEIPENPDVSINGTFKDDKIDTVVFTNENPGPAEVPVLVKKLLDDAEPGKFIFSFVLKDKEGIVLQTKTNDALGAVVFDNLIFEIPGHYTFTLEELVDKNLKSDIAFDPSIYTIEVYVVRDEQFDKNGGFYSAYVTYKKNGLPYEPTAPTQPPEGTVPDPEAPDAPIGDMLEPAPENPVEIPYDAPVFMNVTIPPLPETGDDSNVLLWMGILTVSAVILGKEALSKRRQKG